MRREANQCSSEGALHPVIMAPETTEARSGGSPSGKLGVLDTVGILDCPADDQRYVLLVRPALGWSPPRPRGDHHGRMGVVTNVLIHYDNLEANELPDLIAAWFDERHVGIKSITDGGARAFWGGEKDPECDLLAGAFNYLDLEDMLAHLAALPWEY